MARRRVTDWDPGRETAGEAAGHGNLLSTVELSNRTRPSSRKGAREIRGSPYTAGEVPADVYLRTDNPFVPGHLWLSPATGATPHCSGLHPVETRVAGFETVAVPPLRSPFRARHTKLTYASGAGLEKSTPTFRYI